MLVTERNKSKVRLGKYDTIIGCCMYDYNHRSEAMNPLSTGMVIKISTKVGLYYDMCFTVWRGTH